MRLTGADIAQMWKARAEAAEAERDAWKAAALATNEHLGRLAATMTADEVRAALAEPVEPQRDAVTKSFDRVNAVLNADVEPLRKALEDLAAGVGEPQPSACATCRGHGILYDPEIVECPSCTPPDPESETIDG